MTKLKAPLLRGGKIGRAEIHNNIQLLDSYKFKTATLAKFPAIFNIEEEKKGCSPHMINRLDFWTYRGPVHTVIIMNRIHTHPQKERTFLSGTTSKYAMRPRFSCRNDDVLSQQCHSVA